MAALATGTSRVVGTVRSLGAALFVLAKVGFFGWALTYLRRDEVRSCFATRPDQEAG